MTINTFTFGDACPFQDDVNLKNNFLKIVFLLCILVNPMCIFGQELNVEGKAKISKLELKNTADSLVVWLSDSTLARRDLSSLPMDSLKSVLTKNNDGGGLQIKNIADPAVAQDAATKAYVDQMMLTFGISLGEVAIQGLLDVGFDPLEIIAAGGMKDDLIGKTYQKGLIFYLDDLDTLPGIEGMVAAPYGWFDGGDDPLLPWGCQGLEITSGGGANSILVGDGEQNTMNILTDCLLPGTAAFECDAINLNGFDDWHLPSLGEAGLMWENLQRYGCLKDATPCPTSIGGALNENYWSSTQGALLTGNPLFLALGGNNADGLSFGDLKDEPHRVRPIRAF